MRRTGWLGLVAVLATVTLVPVAQASAATRYVVSAYVSSTRVVSGHTVRLHGRVSPRAAGQRVHVQRYAAGAWHTVKEPRLHRRSRYSVLVGLTRIGTIRLRVVMPRRRGHARGVSRVLSVRVRSATPADSGGGPMSDWASLAVGAFQVCGIRNDHSLWCWGANDLGQSGSTANLGTRDANPLPSRLGGDSDWVSLTAGDFHTCGVRGTHTAWCWGENDAGQLGTRTNLATPTPNPAPIQVGSAVDWVALAAGHWHTCGVKLDGTLWCWGDNQYGQLGSDADALQDPGPTQVGTDTDWTSVTAGGLHTCALKADHTLWCWGDNPYGQLGVDTGTGTQAAQPTPVQVDGSWASVAAGDRFTCGTRSEGTLWCWGRNDHGQLAEPTNLGTDTPNPHPAQVGGDTDWAGLAPGVEHACAVKSDGTAWCWGDPYRGELGTATTGTDPVTAPAKVRPGTTWTGLSAGWASTCGLQAYGTAWCWGDNSIGELGSGTNSGTAVPNSAPHQVGSG